VSTQLDLDWYLSDVDYADDRDFPGFRDTDVVDGELTAPIVPIAPDEFRCGGCYLIRHRSQLSRSRQGTPICRECD
jgi:hypothetical protein